jgi:predicted peptidase
MGGAGTGLWADKNPERFAAMVPSSAGGQTGPKDKLIVIPEALKDLPIQAFYGTADEVCPPQQIEELVNQIKKLDGKTPITLYDGTGHGGIIERVYGDREVFEWSLSQQRPQKC